MLRYSESDVFHSPLFGGEADLRSLRWKCNYPPHQLQFATSSFLQVLLPVTAVYI